MGVFPNVLFHFGADFFVCRYRWRRGEASRSAGKVFSRPSITSLLLEMVPQIQIEVDFTLISRSELMGLK